MNGQSSLKIDIADGNYIMNMVIIMYADDTVLLDNSPEKLQRALNTLNKYCNTWNIKVNESISLLCIIMSCWKQ